MVGSTIAKTPANKYADRCTDSKVMINASLKRLCRLERRITHGVFRVGA